MKGLIKCILTFTLTIAMVVTFLPNANLVVNADTALNEDDLKGIINQVLDDMVGSDDEETDYLSSLLAKKGYGGEDIEIFISGTELTGTRTFDNSQAPKYTWSIGDVVILTVNLNSKNHVSSANLYGIGEFISYREEILEKIEGKYFYDADHEAYVFYKNDGFYYVSANNEEGKCKAKMTLLDDYCLADSFDKNIANYGWISRLSDYELRLVNTGYENENCIYFNLDSNLNIDKLAYQFGEHDGGEAALVTTNLEMLDFNDDLLAKDKTILTGNYFGNSLNLKAESGNLNIYLGTTKMDSINSFDLLVSLSNNRILGICYDSYFNKYEPLLAKYNSNNVITEIEYSGILFQNIHNHSWNYSVIGNKIEAYCENDNCLSLTNSTNKISLTLSASTPNYSGSTATITIGTQDEILIWESAGLSVPTTVTYEKQDGTLLAEAPKTAGSYVAKVSPVGETPNTDNTAQIMFYITDPVPTPTPTPDTTPDSSSRPEYKAPRTDVR